MASDKVVEFTDANFKSEVLNADVPVLVDFWAEWCAPCRALSPTIDAIAGEFDGKVKVGKVNVDDNQGISIEHKVTAIPTVMIFKGGEMRKKFVGLTSAGDLSAALNELVAN
ncbi:MAG: thioredoxin [Phycisphaeraceae bacterium]|nr:thioredoxin [Phycisphaerales bacterium]MCB9842078.1 thioredoxin [Phycisphaeraceae bacterium]